MHRKSEFMFEIVLKTFLEILISNYLEEYFFQCLIKKFLKKIYQNFVNKGRLPILGTVLYIYKIGKYNQL